MTLSARKHKRVNPFTASDTETASWLAVISGAELLEVERRLRQHLRLVTVRRSMVREEINVRQGHTRTAGQRTAGFNGD